MPETLEKQHETQLEIFRKGYVEALSKQWAATKEELSDLQESIVSDENIVSETLKDSGIVEETLGSIPKYFLDEYLSGWFWGWIIGPLFLKANFDKEAFEQIKACREEMKSLKDKIGTDSFASDLWSLKGKYLEWSTEVADTTPHENPSDVFDLHGKVTVPWSSIVSAPYEMGETTTLCSATAQNNAKTLFDITLPSGNAIDAQNIDVARDQKDSNGHAISSETKDAFIESISSNKPFDHAPDNATIADLFVQSSNAKWHRSFAFRNASDNEWYVLDPYRSPNSRSTAPKKLTDYMQKNTLVKANFYETEKVVVADDYEHVDSRMAA